MLTGIPDSVRISSFFCTFSFSIRGSASPAKTLLPKLEEW